MGYDPTVPRNKIEIAGENHTRAGCVWKTPGKQLTMMGSLLHITGNLLARVGSHFNPVGSDTAIAGRYL